MADRIERAPHELLDEAARAFAEILVMHWEETQEPSQRVSISPEDGSLPGPGADAQSSDAAQG